MKKKLLAFLSLALTISLAVGCGAKKDSKVNEESKKEEVKTVKVFVPDGIPALAATKLMKEKPVIDKNITVEYNVEKTSDALVAKVLNSEADIAVVPSNLAAQAYNKGLAYKLAATSGWGSFFVISNDEVKDFQDLKGKEIYNIGKGLTPDIIFRYILTKNNIDPDKDLQINYLNAATELAPTFISGKANIAVMPEPMLTTVTMKKPNAKISLDLNKEWNKITGSQYGYPQSSIIIKKDLIEKDKKFVEEFLKQYKDSIEWANNNGAKLGEYAEELQLSINKATTEKAVARANMKFVAIKDCKKEYENYFKVLLDFEPKSIGGKMPDEGLYMEK